MAAISIQPQKSFQMSDQDRFFKFFQGEVTALQERMQKLETYSTSERSDAVDSCLSGIANLTSAVKDASSYLPAYDQRTYSDAIKALTEKLQKSRATLAPRQKFSFKSGFPRKNASAISISDAAALATARLQTTGVSSNESSIAPTPLDSPGPGTPAPEMTTTSEAEPDSRDSRPNNDNPCGRTGRDVRMPSFSNKNTILISSHENQHIILPSSASHATASGTLSNLNSCVVDMTLATEPSRPSTPSITADTASTPSGGGGGSPFAALYLKNIKNSLIICGHVDGAAHITNLRNTTLVLSCRQFRMHESHNCNIYLFCASHPIIEDCTGLGFTSLPASFPSGGVVGKDGQAAEVVNRFAEVDDFKWLKAEASPNWRVLREDELVDESVWRDVVPGKPGAGHEEILRAVGIDPASL